MSFFLDVTMYLCIAYICVIIMFLIGLFFPKRASNKTLISVSVIVAARNEETNIKNLMADLCRQNYPHNLYEIIIADDGSTDRTQEIVHEFAKKYQNIRQVHIANIPAEFSPKKYALQKAVENAKGDIILATDADCRMGPEWITSMVKYFTPDVGLVIGFSQFGKKRVRQKLIERLQTIDFLILMGAASGGCNLGLSLAATGQNLGYRRAAFDQVGGYSRVAHRASGDDVLLLQLVRKLTSFKIVFATDPGSHTSSAPQPNARDLINQRKRWASNGSYQLFLNLPFFGYLLLVYLFNAFLLVGTLLMLFGLGPGQVILLLIVFKFISEFLLAWRIAVVFQRTDLLVYFLPWFLLQIPYVIFVGFLGTTGNFHWKGRTHKNSFGSKLLW